MKALALSALTAAVLVSPVATGAASAAPDPTGILCDFVASTDSRVTGIFTGVVVGGPLAFTDDADGTLAHTGTLVCTIQVGLNDTHGETDGPVVTGNQGRVSAVAGTTTTYHAAEEEDQYICSHVDFGGAKPALYWDAVADGWSTSSAVPCALTISVEPNLGMIELDNYIYCPIWSVVFPPEGDIVLPVFGKIWDCPPYDLYGEEDEQ